AHEDEGGLGPLGRRQPSGARHMEPRPYRRLPCDVDDTEVRVKDPDPEHGGRHHRNDRRNIIDRPVPGHTRDLGVQEHGYGKPGYQSEGDTEEGKETCVIERLRHQRPVVCQKLMVVVQTDPAGIVQYVVVAETEDDGSYYRPDGKEQEAYYPGACK